MTHIYSTIQEELLEISRMRLSMHNLTEEERKRRGIEIVEMAVAWARRNPREIDFMLEVALGKHEIFGHSYLNTQLLDAIGQIKDKSVIPNLGKMAAASLARP